MSSFLNISDQGDMEVAGTVKAKSKFSRRISSMEPQAPS